LRIFDQSLPLVPQFDGVDVVIDEGGSVGTREMADAAEGQARLWQILGTGLDHFDMDYWRGKGIPVANCPGPFSSVALAECVMMFILMLTRKYDETQSNLYSQRMYEPVGIELEDLKLGIIGLGASGMELARRARPFGMRILAIDIRDVSADEIEEFGVEFVGKPDAMDTVISKSDILSLHLHLNLETHHVIDKRRLGLMKPTAYLINVARGALVDEVELEQALQSGQIAGAGIDAFGQEPPDINSAIFSMSNVVTTPHIAGVTNGTSRKRAEAAANNVDRVASGLEALYRVD
jgi:D-3-phosphoglycerate dehydrogenase